MGQRDEMCPGCAPRGSVRSATVPYYLDQVQLDLSGVSWFPGKDIYESPLRQQEARAEIAWREVGERPFEGATKAFWECFEKCVKEGISVYDCVQRCERAAVEEIARIIGEIERKARDHPGESPTFEELLSSKSPEELGFWPGVEVVIGGKKGYGGKRERDKESGASGAEASGGAALLTGPKPEVKPGATPETRPPTTRPESTPSRAPGALRWLARAATALLLLELKGDTPRPSEPETVKPPKQLAEKCWLRQKTYSEKYRVTVCVYECGPDKRIRIEVYYGPEYDCDPVKDEFEE